MGLGMIDVAAAVDRATPGVVRAFVGEWIVRSSLGETGRANSCAPIGDPGRAVAAAVDMVETWYDECDRPVMFQLFDDTDIDVRRELDRRRYRTGAVTDVLASALDDLRVSHVPIEAEVNETMPELLREQLGSARADEMRSTRQPCWCAVALIDGEPAGAGLAIADDDLVVGLCGADRSGEVGVVTGTGAADRDGGGVGGGQQRKQGEGHVLSRGRTHCLARPRRARRGMRATLEDAPR